MQDRQAPSLLTRPEPTQNRWVRCARWALRALTLLALLCLLILGAVALWLHREPHVLASRLAEEIQQRTGMQCSLGAVDVVLLPVPSLGIADVRMTTAELDFSTAFATVRPALWSLLRGQFAPGSVTLLRPTLHRNLPSGQVNDALSIPLAQALVTLEQKIPEQLHGMNLQILHGVVHSEMEQGRTLDIDNISTDIHIFSGGLSGRISLGQTVLRHEQAIIFSLDALQLDMGGKLLRIAQGADAQLRLDTRLHIPGLLQGLHVRMDAAQRTSMGEGTPHVEMQADLQGGLLWEGAQPGTWATLPLSIQAKGKGSLEKGLHLEDMRIALAQDRLRGHALLSLPSAENGAKQGMAPRLTGELDIQRLSLTQWFGFARRLPPGLQNTLHHIQGSLRFDMDSQGLDVPHIGVTAAGGLFTGKGGVPLWSQPVVTLDLSAPQIALGKALPEVEGQSPPVLTFSHVPLTPEPGTDAAKGMAGPEINYDINLRVGKLTAWQLHVDDVSFRCIPAAWGTEADTVNSKDSPKGSPSKNASAHSDSRVLMTFGAGQVYGGRGEGQLLLHTPTPGKTGYSVKASLRNVNMEQLLPRLTPPMGKAAASPAFLTGRLQLDTEFTAQGRTLPAFFASQEGSLALRLDNGHVLRGVATKEKLPFTRLRLEAKLRSGDQIKFPEQDGQHGQGGQNKQGKQSSRPQFSGHKGNPGLPAELNYTGQWKLALDSPRLKAALQMEGPLTFSGKQLLPVKWHKVPGHLMVEADKALLSEWQILPAPGKSGGKEGGNGGGSRKLDISGRFSLHSGERSFAVEDAEASLPDFGGVQLRGQIQGAVPPQGAQNAWLDGTVEGHVASARTLLRPFLPSMVDSLPASTLHRAEGKAKLAYKDKSLTVTDMRVKLDNTTAAGRLSGAWKEKPAWKFDLDVDTLDLDTWLPPRQTARKSTETASGKTVLPTPLPSPLWKLDWMREMDAQGQLRIQSLRLRKFTLRQARIPLQLRNATLECAALRGDFYGAPLKASLKAKTTENVPGLKLQFTTEAQGINMRTLSEDKQMDTLLAGQGALRATIQGMARSGADIPAALDGAWSLQVDEAYTQSRQAKSTASRTQLGEIRTSGSLEKGVLRSNNLTISGASMQARGGGWVNLDKDTLDVALTVNMFRIPEFPVRFYGNLDNPQRSINAGKAITSTLGNLGSEVVDVIGNVIGGALRILP